MKTEVSRPKRIKCLAVPHTTSEEFKNATIISGFVFGENSAVHVHYNLGTFLCRSQTATT